MTTGIKTLDWPNGQRHAEVPFFNGQIHGLSKQWHRDGPAAYLAKWHQHQWVWNIHFNSEENIPTDAEVELFFHPMPKLS